MATEQQQQQQQDNKEPEMSHEEFLLRDGRSILNFISAGASSCGYCDNRAKIKNKQSSSKAQTDDDESNLGRKCYNMITFKLNSEDYQALLDRGWRRSGTLCYWPINSQACCPNYPIICKALEFRFTRSKRKCIRNLNNFLITGLYPSEIKMKNQKELLKLNYEQQQQEQYREIATVKSRYDMKTFDELKESTKAKDKRFVKSCERKVKLYNVTIEEAIKRTRDRTGRSNIIKLPLESYLYPHKSILYNSPTKITSSKTKLQNDEIVDDDDESFKPKHELEIRMNHVDSEESMLMRDAEHELLIKYQEAVHKEPESDWTFHRFIDFLVDSPLFVEPFDPEKYDYIENSEGDSEDIYSKKVYDHDESEYLLVKPPNLPTAYGTYHCTYHLDGKLIACGVLDVLPKCITTVYFFYDPKYSELNLGYYSALVEISMVRQLAKHFRGDKKDNKLTDYYVGFYVHECLKMHYKTRFEPSYLLCSETAQYVPTRECLKKLVKGKIKYARFSSKEVPNAYTFKPTKEDISKIPISLNLFGNSSFNINDYFKWLDKNLGPEYGPALVINYLEPYAKLVGRDLLPKIILQLNSVHQGLLNRYLLVTEHKKTGKQDKK